MYQCIPQSCMQHLESSNLAQKEAAGVVQGKYKTVGKRCRAQGGFQGSS